MAVVYDDFSRPPAVVLVLIPCVCHGFASFPEAGLRGRKPLDELLGRLIGPHGLALWLDGKPTPLSTSIATLDPPTGRHRLTLAIDRTAHTEPLRVIVSGETATVQWWVGNRSKYVKPCRGNSNPHVYTKI